MSTNTFAKTVVAAGGLFFLLLCAAPEFALGQSTQPGAAAAAPMTLAPHGKPAGPPDFFEGLTLTSDQKARIDQIRADSKNRLALVANDTKLSPEAADAFRRGYERSENARILDVLTPEQQQAVRKRIAAWRTAAGKPQYPARKPAASEQTPPSQ